MSRQRRDNVSVKKNLSKLHHSPEGLFGETLAILGRQLRGQCLDNLLPIVGPFVPKHVLSNPFSDLPIHHHQGRIDRLGRLHASGFDDLADVAKQVGNRDFVRLARGQRRFRCFRFSHDNETSLSVNLLLSHPDCLRSPQAQAIVRGNAYQTRLANAGGYLSGRERNGERSSDVLYLQVARIHSMRTKPNLASNMNSARPDP